MLKAGQDTTHTLAERITASLMVAGETVLFRGLELETLELGPRFSSQLYSCLIALPGVIHSLTQSDL